MTFQGDGPHQFDLIRDDDPGGLLSMALPNALICRDDVAQAEIDQSNSATTSWCETLVPAVQCLPGGILEDGLFVVISGEAADGVQAGEERDEGEENLPAVLVAQQAGTAKSADGMQVLADLSFVMTLIIIGGGYSARFQDIGMGSPSARYERAVMPR